MTIELKWFLVGLLSFFAACSSTADFAFEEQTKTITFKKIVMAQESLKESDYRMAIQRKVGDFEACSQKNYRLVPVENHPFIQALVYAFNEHRPISISPDHVWLLICQGWANHIHFQSDTFRPLIVDFTAKKEIKIKRNKFIKGNQNNDWEGVFAELVDSVKTNSRIGSEMSDAVFSTTGDIEKAVFQISLLNAYTDFFDYTLRTICGIPAIRLEGTPQDWKIIQHKVELLRKYGLDWWVEELKPIVEQFVHASQGQVEASFWRSIFRYSAQSGGHVINGWIIKLFPYIVVQDLDGKISVAINPLVNKNIKNYDILRVNHSALFSIAALKKGKPNATLEIRKAIESTPEQFYGLLLGNFSTGLSMTPLK